MTSYDEGADRMSDNKHDLLCEKCEVHSAWEERMKILEKVPMMLSWMNYIKGAMAVIVAIMVVAFPIFYTHIMTIRAESTHALEKQDEKIKEVSSTLSSQVNILNGIAMGISKDVAVFVAKSDLKYEALASEISNMKHPEAGYGRK